MKALGDRREHIRLEVVGSLWGTLDVNKRARVVNVSGTGALIASPIPAAVDSTQTVKLTLEGREFTLEARVRHMKEVANPSDDGTQYQIGLEFLGTSPALALALE
jgi:hypothetical protein